MCADYRLISIKSGYIFAVVWNFEGQLQRVTIMYDFKILPIFWSKKSMILKLRKITTLRM